jgi:hypothetical protein
LSTPITSVGFSILLPVVLTKGDNKRKAITVTARKRMNARKMVNDREKPDVLFLKYKTAATAAPIKGHRIENQMGSPDII